MRNWQLQAAKARLSELVREAVRDGPQGITVHGRDEVVVLARTDYDRLVDRNQSFVEFMTASPLKGLPLDIERDRSPARDLDL
jgi:prevent-host-death family protein